MRTMRSRWRWWVATELVALSFGATTAVAQTRWRLDLRLDNDFFVEFSPTKSTDHEYTHGTALILRSLAPNRPCGTLRRLEVGVSQLLYTPRDESPFAPDQRQHGGWLRVSGACVAPAGSTGSSVGFTIGLVGPAAGGAGAQRLVHAIFRFREPEGWDQQLPTRIDLAT